MFICIVLGSPKLGTWSHMWLHQGCRGENDDIHQPAVNGLPNAVKEAVVFILCHKERSWFIFSLMNPRPPDPSLLG